MSTLSVAKMKNPRDSSPSPWTKTVKKMTRWGLDTPIKRCFQQVECETAAQPTASFPAMANEQS